MESIAERTERNKIRNKKARVIVDKINFYKQERHQAFIGIKSPEVNEYIVSNIDNVLAKLKEEYKAVIGNY